MKGKEDFSIINYICDIHNCCFNFVGACKFGFYEYFKHLIARKVNERGYISEKVKLPIWMAASSAAEVVASFALCPLEVTKIYMMMNTDDAKNGLLHCMANIVHRDGPSGLFTGLPLIMLRQIPYTCVKLSGYEVFSRMMTNLLSVFGCFA